MSNNRHSIIIVGSGKAALLHLGAYTRLWEGQKLPEIHIIAGDVVEPEIKKIVKKHSPYFQFTTFQQAAGLNQAHSLVDICTPTQTHKSVIKKMFDIGFIRFLVEKPLVTTIRDLEWIKSSNICLAVMQNYIFSQATQRTLDLIGAGEIMPKSMVSFFCKDRIQETVQMRGFNDANPPHAFTIELPHQLYLASAFLGSAKVISAYAQNMQVGDILFSEHGVGIISLEHSNSKTDGFGHSNSLHFSCLFSNQCIKRVLIIDHVGQTLTIDYPNTKGILTSKIEIQNGKQTIYQEVFENDDMMKWALEHYCARMFADDLAYTADHCRYSIDDALLVIEALTKSNGNASPVINGESVCRNCHNLCKQYSVSLPCVFLKREI